MSHNKKTHDDMQESKQKSIVVIVILAMVCVVLITFVLGKAFSSSSLESPTGSNLVTKSTSSDVAVSQPADIRDGKQYVSLSMSGSRYVLNPSALVVNVPVVMTVDMSTVYGCMRDIVIPEFNIRKYVTSGDNTIEFTPNELGTFKIQCSMDMGRGAFTVVEFANTVSSTQIPVVEIASSGTCGGSAGGCGCGSR